jgi:hypothetical protein
MATGITLAEFAGYKLTWFGHPERHFIIYKNEIAIVMTKYEKEAIATFSKLREKYENS